MSEMLRKVLMGFSVSLLLVAGVVVPKANAQAQYTDVTVSYNDFYQDLANYGQWIEDPQYGYVWSPNVDGSFRPYYTNGYWAMTEYGNTWVSDYPWGWACFHYGRWTYDNYYGWLWLPGSTWGPAWVSWRGGEGYYGWAPLGPNYEVGMNYTDYSCPNNWWVFLSPQYLYSGNYYHYWNGPRENAQFIANTNSINNTYSNNNITYVTGPRTKEVETASHQPVKVYHLAHTRNLNGSVHNNVIKLYHPAEIKPIVGANGNAAPPNMVHAPQPVKPAQAVKTADKTATPEFRNNLPRNNGHEETPGTNVGETAKPTMSQPAYGTNPNPYEYDVNQPVTQPQPRQQPAQQQSWPQQPQNQAPRSQPQQPQQQPQQPTQQPRPQPVQQPQPQRAPTQTPAPAPARQPVGR